MNTSYKTMTQKCAFFYPKKHKNVHTFEAEMAVE